MLVYRSFVVGMLGAIALLIATLPSQLAERREREPLAIIHVSESALAASPEPGKAMREMILRAFASGDRLIIIIEP